MDASDGVVDDRGLTSFDPCPVISCPNFVQARLRPRLRSGRRNRGYPQRIAIRPVHA